MLGDKRTLTVDCLTRKTLHSMLMLIYQYAIRDTGHGP